MKLGRTSWQAERPVPWQTKVLLLLVVVLSEVRTPASASAALVLFDAIMCVTKQFALLQSGESIF